MNSLRGREFNQLEKEELQRELQAIRQGLQQQEEHTRKAKEMVAEAAKYLKIKRQEIIGRVKQDQQRYRTKPPTTPRK